MGKYFGTDGIRGVVNSGLDAWLAFRTGQAAAVVLSKGREGKPLFTIGKDTRISCDMLEAAIIAGICTAGANVMTLGVVPTPAVAFITKNCGADAGIVISASHNPYEHNGIKIFNSEGFKLSDEIEDQIEELIDSPAVIEGKLNSDIGRVVGRGREYVDKYIDHVVSAAKNEIKRLKVVIDCSNGAASRTVNQIFSRFPLDLEIIKDHPDGININDNCGSTHMEGLARIVNAGGFDVGIAFDGDADRCLVVDENGNMVDGDKIMAICGASMKAKGTLKGNMIVATVMSNMGFEDYAKKSGLNVCRTAVGDRYVLEKMQECGYNLGGEQSGHLIFLDDETTGDGQLAAVKFLSVLSEQGKKVSELVSQIPEYPQRLENIPIEGGNDVKKALMEDRELSEAVKADEEKLKDRGRILVRPSGTEALIRVMVEAETQQLVDDCTTHLTDLIKKRSKELFS